MGIKGLEKLPAIQWKLMNYPEDRFKKAEGISGKTKASTRIVKSISPI